MVMHTLWIAEFLTVVLTLTKISVTAIAASAYLIIVEIFYFSRSIFKRSLSDGNLCRDIISPISATNVKQVKMSHSALPDQSQGAINFLSESSPEISTCDSDIAFSRFGYITVIVGFLKAIVQTSIGLPWFSFSCSLGEYTLWI